MARGTTWPRPFLGGRLPKDVGQGKGARRWTYARVGVDPARVGVAVSALTHEVRYRAPARSGRPLVLPGHFAGVVQVGRERLALTTDTVGTKTLLAEELNRWGEVGEDLVGVNVNDLAAIGARPSALVDTILCRAPDTRILRAIGRGINRGLERAECSLLGGETAIVPEMVEGFDLGATALGFFPGNRQPILGNKIRPGDELLGLPSRGVHANGFTLIRRLVKSAHVDLSARRTGGPTPLGVELLRPTRIYTRASEAIADDAATRGLAHITGGGVRNLARLNRRVRFSLDSWPEPTGIFAWLADLGRIPARELYQTFNMGIGFVVAVRSGNIDRILTRLSESGLRDGRKVGDVETGSGVALPHLGVTYPGYH